MKSRLVLVESVKISGDSNIMESSLILSPQPKLWLMVIHWQLSSRARKSCQLSITLSSTLMVLVFFNADLVLKFWKFSGTNSCQKMHRKWETISSNSSREFKRKTLGLVMYEEEAWWQLCNLWRTLLQKNQIPSWQQMYWTRQRTMEFCSEKQVRLETLSVWWAHCVWMKRTLRMQFKS